MSIVCAEDVQTLSHLANYVRVPLTLECRTEDAVKAKEASRKHEWSQVRREGGNGGSRRLGGMEHFLAKYFQFNQTPTNKNANAKADRTHTHAKPPHKHETHIHMRTHTRTHTHTRHLNKNKHGKWLGIL